MHSPDELGAWTRSRPSAPAESNLTYLSRILRLTLLAPDIIEAILNGRQHNGLKLAIVLRHIPLTWEEPRRDFGWCEPERRRSKAPLAVRSGWVNGPPQGELRPEHRRSHFGAAVWREFIKLVK